ncbi:MAG: hypothetical protein WCW47_02880 [Candidatus Paceibacterota bacterium]
MSEEGSKTEEVEKNEDADLTEDGIVEQTRLLRETIVRLKKRQQSYLEEKVKLHRELASNLPGLFELLQEAETLRTMFVSMRETGEFTRSDEAELKKVEGLIRIRKNQFDAEKERLALLASQPAVFEEIQGEAVIDRGIEIRDEGIKAEIKVLEKEVDKIISKIDESFNDSGNPVNSGVRDMVYDMVAEVRTKAYELLKKNGITSTSSLEGSDINAPKRLFLYFEEQLRPLCGIEEVRTEGKLGEHYLKNEIINDNPKKKAIRSIYFSNGLSTMYGAFIND